MRVGKRMTVFQRFNRFVAKIRGSVGWCCMSYRFNRMGLPEDDGFPAIAPQGRVRAWWGAFGFEYKGIDE